MDNHNLSFPFVICQLLLCVCVFVCVHAWVHVCLHACVRVNFEDHEYVRDATFYVHFNWYSCTVKSKRK